MTDFPLFAATLLAYPGRPGTQVVAEFALPTGSFKDRGAAAVVADASARGARRVTLDSSGNAGLAVAAASARAGMPALIRVTTSISLEKAALIRAAGAAIEVHASRDDAAIACVRDGESYDASHIRNPVFRRGVATLPRLWLESGPIPGSIYLPLGNGSLLLGLWEGLRALAKAGRIASLPRLVAAQPDRWAPIASPGAQIGGRTIADGCAISAPPAAAEIRAAILESGGTAIAIPESEIEHAWLEAWRDGFPIEPTSALAFAALKRSPPPGPAAVIATGSGLKLYPGSSPSATTSCSDSTRLRFVSD